jgi:hypothetical protein
VNLKDDKEEDKEINKEEPITVRKDYYSDEDVKEKKNSFRKYVLGASEYNKEDTPFKESSSEQDISLLHGLPASMMKLMHMSVDKSDQSFYENPPEALIERQTEENDEKDSSEVDLNLKFLNKHTIRSRK